MHDLLNIVQQHMLVPQPKDRLSIESILRLTKNILNQSVEDAAYAFVGNPRHTSSFPPLFDERKYQDQLRRRKTSETWLVANSAADTISTVIYSEDQLQQFGNDFFQKKLQVRVKCRSASRALLSQRLACAKPIDRYYNTPSLCYGRGDFWAM